MANRVSFVILAKDSFTKVGRKVVNTTDKMLARFGKMKLGLGALSNKFTGLLGVMAGFAGVNKFFREGMAFEDAIADLSAITGATGKDLKFLTDEALRLAKAQKVSAAETVEGFKLVASAKDELLEDPKGLSNVTNQVLLLSNAAGIDLVTSAKVVTEALNQFNASADDAGKFVNILAAGAKFGASEVEDSGPAIVKSGVAANLAKLSFEELNATLQILAKRGIKGVIAGTQLKTSLIKLESSGIKRITPSVVGYITALENLNKMQLNTTQLSKLFGLEAINTGKTIVQEVAAISEMTKTLTGTDTAMEQASIRGATFSKKLKLIGITINEALIKTFMRLEKDKTFTKIANQLTEWLDSIDSTDIIVFTQAVKDLIFTIGQLGKAAAKTFDLIAIGPKIEFKDIIEAIKRDSKASLFDVLDVTKQRLLTPPTPIAGAVAGAGAMTLSPVPVAGIQNAVAPKSEADVNINLKAPKGTVDSVKATAKTPDLKVGVNMETSP